MRKKCPWKMALSTPHRGVTIMERTLGQGGDGGCACLGLRRSLTRLSRDRFSNIAKFIKASLPRSIDCRVRWALADLAQLMIILT